MASSSKHTPSPHAKKKHTPFHHLGLMVPSSFPLHHVISFLSPQQLQPYPLGFLGRSPCFWCLRHSSEFLPMTFRSINFQCCKNTPWTMLGLWVLLPQHPVSPLLPWQLGRVLHPHSWLLTCKVLWEGLPSLVQAWLNHSPSEYGFVGGMWTKKICLGFVTSNGGPERSSCKGKSPMIPQGASVSCWMIWPCSLWHHPPPKKSTFQLTNCCAIHCPVYSTVFL